MKRVSLGTNVKVGDVIRLTAWLKGANLVPDSAALYPGTWSVGLTPLWFAKGGNNDGYDVLQASDYTWQFPAVTSFDWTPYTLDLVVPADAKVLEVRLHVYSRFHRDDLLGRCHGPGDRCDSPACATRRTVCRRRIELGENYPNPFNPSTKIQFGLPTDAQASIVIYNTLGQKVRTLVDGFRAAGRYEVVVGWQRRLQAGRSARACISIASVSGQTAVVKKMLLVK